MSEDQKNLLDTGSVTEHVNSIITQFGLISGDADRVKQDCGLLQAILTDGLVQKHIASIKPLFPLLQKKNGSNCYEFI